jgi:hypothetical protein
MNIDLDGYPVLRIDQISFIDSNILQNADKDVLDLITSLRSSNDDSQHSLAIYLEKQLNAMRKELTLRAASDRISSLLESSQSLLKNNDSLRHSNNAHLRPDVPVSNDIYITPKTGDNTANNLKCNTHSISKFQSIPLPSQLQKNDSFMCNDDKQIKEDTYDNLIESSSIPDLSSNKIKRDDKDLPTQRPRSEISIRKSTMITNLNFGTSFIVAPTEQKRRFYPKKEKLESEEDKKEKERISRLYFFLLI